MKRIGGNSRLLSRLLNLPLKKVEFVLQSLLMHDSLSLFALIETEKMGLNKAIIWCDKSSINYDIAKNLVGPLASLFRGDIEENKFLLMFYTNEQVFEQYKNTIDNVLSKTDSLCEIKYIKKYYRYINVESCYDFKLKKWACDDKEVFISYPAKEIVNLDKNDVDLLVKIQVNPFVGFYFNSHYKHIYQYIKGFMYTLGDTEYLITSKGDYIFSSPFLLWSVKLDDGTYLSEYHVDKENLIKITRELSDNNLIISTKELTFAHGFSVPYEIFKSNKWEMPKIVIE